MSRLLLIVLGLAVFVLAAGTPAAAQRIVLRKVWTGTDLAKAG